MKIPILALKEEFKEYETRPMITASEKVYELLKSIMPHDKEALFLLSLNTRNGIVAIRTISIGLLNGSIVNPREVFRAAIFDNAAQIIVAHNHPSGDPTPSKEDIEITKKLTETGNIIGIKLLDHVIIGDGRHFSMKEKGYI